VENSTAAATALVPALGYARAGDAARQARELGRTLRAVVVAEGWMSAEEFDAAISPEAVCRLGSPPRDAACEAIRVADKERMP
jgi:fumarate hydratase class II